MNLPDTLSPVIFRHLPSRTAKEAQASWKLSDKIARSVSDRLAAMARNAKDAV